MKAPWGRLALLQQNRTFRGGGARVTGLNPRVRAPDRKGGRHCKQRVTCLHAGVLATTWAVLPQFPPNHKSNHYSRVESLPHANLELLENKSDSNTFKYLAELTRKRNPQMPVLKGRKARAVGMEGQGGRKQAPKPTRDRNQGARQREDHLRGSPGTRAEGAGARVCQRHSVCDVRMDALLTWWEKILELRNFCKIRLGELLLGTQTHGIRTNTSAPSFHRLEKK